MSRRQVNGADSRRGFVKGVHPITPMQCKVYVSIKEGSLASVTSIQNDTGFSRMGIMRALDVLVALGYLKQNDVGKMRIVWKEDGKKVGWRAVK